MQRLTACLGAIAMFVALLSAPFYHFHDRDDHGGRSVVHAHFLEAETSAAHPDDSLDSPHSHRTARWVEYYTLDTPATGIDLVGEFTETSFLLTLEVRKGVSIYAAPQAHGPPVTRLSVPRSPPSA